MSETEETATDELEQLRKHWDGFADLFEREMERTTVLLARTLIHHLRVPTATAVLEIGAGAGGAALALLEELPKTATLTVTDLSHEMVARATDKLPERVDVQVADAQALPFPDASFDRVLSNLNLMLVPDPDAVLAEAYRVLQPGGRIAISVWGRRESSTMFTIPPAAAAAAGIVLPEAKRSNFHLGDRTELIAKLEGHGFQRCLSWYQQLKRDLTGGDAYAAVTLQTPRWQGYLADVSAEQADALRAEMVRLADAELAAGDAIGLETLVIVAEKPA